MNDALALKEADLGIAMGDGAPATKAVAQLVMLDDRFSTLPGVVAQGRRVMANMERVSNLFLTKTTYAALLSVAVALAWWPYPFLPRNLTVIGALTIGIPAFILALVPNRRRYVPGFLRRVLGFSIPNGIVAALAVLAVYVPLYLSRDQVQARSAATVVLLVVGLWVLGILARPWSAWRIALVAALAAAGVVPYAVPPARDFLALELPHGGAGLLVGAVAATACLAIELLHRSGLALRLRWFRPPESR